MAEGLSLSAAVEDLTVCECESYGMQGAAVESLTVCECLSSGM